MGQTVLAIRAVFTDRHLPDLQCATMMLWEEQY